jgi:hypothetical protein
MRIRWGGERKGGGRKRRRRRRVPPREEERTSGGGWTSVAGVGGQRRRHVRPAQNKTPGCDEGGRFPRNNLFVWCLSETNKKNPQTYLLWLEEDSCCSMYSSHDDDDGSSLIESDRGTRIYLYEVILDKI